MKNMDLLATALSYMEEHLQEDIRTEDVAGACFCSKSTLEKLFRNVNHISVHDYVIRRRMMKAARMLFENPDVGVLEVALCYGYGTNEAFTRAFKQVWNCKPSEFRKGRRYCRPVSRARARCPSYSHCLCLLLSSRGLSVCCSYP